MRWSLLLLLGLMLTGCSAEQSPSSSPPPASASVTPSTAPTVEATERQPDGCPVSAVGSVRLESGAIRGDIARGIGDDSARMISQPDVPWSGPGAIKTIWLVSSSFSGPVTLTGHRLDGDDVAGFAYGDIPFQSPLPNATAEDVDRLNETNRALILAARSTEAVFAGPHDMNRDERGFVFYDSPGCWQFTLESADRRADIVQRVYRALGTP